jgi:hypothetical protein
VTVIAADEGESRPRRHAVTAVGMEGFIFVLFCVSASLLCYSVVLLLLWSDRANAKKHNHVVFGLWALSRFCRSWDGRNDSRVETQV